jgi:hypothetical protein
MGRHQCRAPAAVSGSRPRGPAPSAAGAGGGAARGHVAGPGVAPLPGLPARARRGPDHGRDRGPGPRAVPVRPLHRPPWTGGGAPAIAFGLEIVSDASRRSAQRKSCHRAPARLGLRRRGGWGRCGSRRASMNNSDREILVAEINDPRVLIPRSHGLFSRKDFIDLFFHDVSRSRRCRLPGLGECRQRTESRRNNQHFHHSVLHGVPPCAYRRFRHRQYRGPGSMGTGFRRADGCRPSRTRCDRHPSGPLLIAPWRGGRGQVACSSARARDAPRTAARSGRRASTPHEISTAIHGADCATSRAIASRLALRGPATGERDEAR